MVSVQGCGGGGWLVHQKGLYILCKVMWLPWYHLSYHYCHPYHWAVIVIIVIVIPITITILIINVLFILLVFIIFTIFTMRYTSQLSWVISTKSSLPTSRGFIWENRSWLSGNWGYEAESKSRLWALGGFPPPPPPAPPAPPTAPARGKGEKECLHKILVFTTFYK